MHLYAGLRVLAGGRTVELALHDGASVRDLLSALVRARPALRDHLLDASGGLSRRVQVFVDGRNVRYLDAGLETPVGPASRVDVFPPVAGGARGAGGREGRAGEPESVRHPQSGAAARRALYGRPHTAA